jgi:hypothetical protein
MLVGPRRSLASLAGAQTPILYGFDGNAAFAVRGSVAAHLE